MRSNLEPIEPADHELLLAFVQGSEPAFATLVRRHIDLVYSAALRQVQDPHTAADVTSAVFIILARKAGELRKHLIIPAWLHRTTSYTARKAVRARQRRVSYEQAAARLNEVSVQEPTNAEWEQMMPFLDAGLADLAAKEHEAVVLRFFQNKTFPEIAAVVGTTEEGARKRVERAVEKLRRFLAGRGIAVPIIVLTAMLGTQSVQAAPAGLASTIIAVPPPGSLSPLVAELLKPDSRIFWKWFLGTMLGLLTLLLVTIPWVRPHFAAWTRSPTQTLRLLNQAAAAGDAERWASLVHTSNAEEQQVTIMLSSNIVAQAEVRRALIQRFGPAAYQASGFSRVFEETPEDLFSTAVERVSEDHATVQLIPRPPLKFINVHGIWKFDFFHTTSATAAQAGRAADRTHAALLETHRHILQGLYTSLDDALLHYKQIR
ncbi:MAG: hypothetical protein JWM16_3674 [Verrucomicrobiales bacterium]|nr:hypothetical protein [Verrucomicrobiales bacterium]